MSKKRSRDGTAPDIAKLEAEKRKLYVSKDNTKRLQQVIDSLNYLYYGLCS